MPLAPRLTGPIEELPSGAILVRLEQKLKTNPNDAEGWRLLARLRNSLGDYEGAGDAWRRVIELQESGEAFVGLATALIEQDDGLISDAALFWIDKALTANPENIAARFWRGAAWQQQGETEKARAQWLALRAQLPKNIPFAAMLDEQLNALPIKDKKE